MNHEYKRKVLALVFEESLFKRILSSVKVMIKSGNFTIHNLLQLLFWLLSTRFWDILPAGYYAVLNIPKLRKMFTALVSAEHATKGLDKDRISTGLYYNLLYLFTRILLELNIKVDNGFETYLP